MEVFSSNGRNSMTGSGAWRQGWSKSYSGWFMDVADTAGSFALGRDPASGGVGYRGALDVR
jgi:hypothetical protein